MGPARAARRGAQVHDKQENAKTDDVADAGGSHAGVRMRSYRIEDWVAFILFWVLAGVVFLQFFTRYVLNDSIGWTEEIARYLLIAVAFIGGGMAVRRMSHIHVEFLYVFLSRRAAFALSTAVDALRVMFLAYATFLGWQVTEIMQHQFMVVFDSFPISVVYGAAMLGLGVMTVRAVQVAIRNWRAGESVLTLVAREGRHQ